MGRPVWPQAEDGVKAGKAAERSEGSLYPARPVARTEAEDGQNTALEW